VTVAPPQEVAQWAAQHGFDKADMVSTQAPSAGTNSFARGCSAFAPNVRITTIATRGRQTLSSMCTICMQHCTLCHPSRRVSCALPRPQVQVLSDRSGAFTRLLGLEQPAGPEGPPCQRFAAVVDNGILLRLVRHTGWHHAAQAMLMHRSAAVVPAVFSFLYSRSI
jgi:hypothetical protein